MDTNNYTTLTPEVFFDESGKPSMEFLSQYCQLPSTKKFIYTGDIYGFDYKRLKFPNIIKAKGITTSEISYQFPDLIFAEILVYYFYLKIPPNIGKLESVDYFQINNFPKGTYFHFIDDNNVLVNGKNLIVNKKWYYRI